MKYVIFALLGALFLFGLTVKDADLKPYADTDACFQRGGAAISILTASVRKKHAGWAHFKAMTSKTSTNQMVTGETWNAFTVTYKEWTGSNYTLYVTGAFDPTTCAMSQVSVREL